MTDYSATLPDWPRAYGAPLVQAQIRSTCEDFRVSEWLGFTPDGDGEHDFLHVEKKGQNTLWVAERLAASAGVRPVDVGFAGMKDRRAITRQWFSVRRPAGSKADWSRFEEAGVRVLEVNRHRRKLKRGAHRGNHFRLALREPRPATADLDERLILMRDQGVPNYFGEQRFGHGARNLELARQLFAGRRLPRTRKSMALSAARAWLFNRILERRVRDGSWNSFLPGDVANLDGSGSVFAVDGIDEVLERRARELDVHPTGALWGKGPPAVSGAAFALEQAVIAGDREFAGGLEAQGLEQARRALRIRLLDFRWDTSADGTLWLEFSLGRGAFATAVLRELVQDPTDPS